MTRGLDDPPRRRTLMQEDHHVVTVEVTRSGFSTFQVPHKHQKKAWVAPKDPRPILLRAGFRSCMLRVVVCVTSSAQLEMSMASKDQNFNATFYTSRVLPRVSTSINDKAPGRLGTGRVQLYHDNASSHTVALTRECIKEDRCNWYPTRYTVLISSSLTFESYRSKRNA